MNRKDIEARLHRSLTSQVRVPQLDRRFDAGVWARIEAQQKRAVATAPAHRGMNWLQLSNMVGGVVAALLIIVFGLRMLSGVSVDVPAPQLSAAQGEQIMSFVLWGITGASLAFGIFLTPLGRRIRAQFNAEFS